MNILNKNIREIVCIKKGILVLFYLGVLVGACLYAESNGVETSTDVYIVPNTHGTVGGWLADFSKERNYCLNNYLDHLNYMQNEPNYCLAFSGVPNLISMIQFEPERIEELKQQIKQGHVELVNGFFLEPSINISGGEALVKCGVEGIRWQKTVMGIKPRLFWMIDALGTHCQMPQIVSGLGLEAMIFCRNNRAKENIFWWDSPDGSRVLTTCLVHYCPSSWFSLFQNETPLTDEQITRMIDEVKERIAHNPPNAPVLLAVGGGDYSLAPVRKEQVTELISYFEEQCPEIKLHFDVPGDFLDAVKSLVKSDRVKLEQFKGDSGYCYNAIWFNNPKVKSWLRKCEHNLQAAEMAAAISSLNSGYEYPTQSLYHAWLQLFLNMDIGTLWGVGGGMVFENEYSWDVKDRFEAVEKISKDTLCNSIGSIPGKRGNTLTVFNPLNWCRNDPVEIHLPNGQVPQGTAFEATGDDGVLVCRTEMPSTGITALKTVKEKVEIPAEVDLPERIETTYYSISVDPDTASLTSIKIKPSMREILGGSANVVVAQTCPKDFKKAADLMLSRSKRKQLSSTEDFKSNISVTKGTLATTIRAVSKFCKDSKVHRVIRIYHDHPRIDFETELENIPDEDVQVLVDFPVAEIISVARRGIPYGFSEWDPCQTSPPLPYYQKFNDHIKSGYSYSETIFPAIRWSACEFKGGGGVAILDRGLTGREIDGQLTSLFLINAVKSYRGYENKWLSGKGKNKFSYALVAYDKDWQNMDIPRLAWEFNQGPIVISAASEITSKSYLETSENVIVEAMRREDNFIEIRMVESKGLERMAEVNVKLPHKNVVLTNLVGEDQKSLKKINDIYRFKIKPQQIITMRLLTDTAVQKIDPLLDWKPLVPVCKRKSLNTRLELKGHPY